MIGFKHIVNTQQDVIRNREANKTFRPLYAAAQRIQSKTNRELVLRLIQCGIDNADDTCVLEQAQPLDQWDAMFRGSIESMLCFPDNWLCFVHGTVGQLHATQRHVNQFFAKHGIRG